MKQPNIPQATSVFIFNDMINANIRSSDREKTAKIEASGMVDSVISCVTQVRKLGMPIFWIRVERRADEKDAITPLTDIFIASAFQKKPPIIHGSREAANLDELRPEPQDHIILKPRFNPFIGTDLDLQLRVRKIDTILLGGYSTNIGVESCARTARDLGYNVIILSDCCFNIDHELHTFAITKILPLFARVLPWQKAVELIK